MEQILKTDNKLVFKTESPDILLNAIRRFANRIPTLAIDEVEISKNSSALYDESIAHRLGLLVLKTEKSFSGKTEKTFELKAKKDGYVLAEELKGDGKLVHDKTPIVILDKGQELELTAIARMGIGKTHSKHTPGTIFYRNSSNIILDKEFEQQIKKTYPDATITNKGNKINVSDDGVKEVTDFCTGLAESVGKEVEVEYNDDLVVGVESFGHLNSSDIVLGSIKELKKELGDVAKQISKA